MPRWMSKKILRELLSNLTFGALPLLVLYLIFEFFIFKNLLMVLPLRYQQSLLEPIQMLCEISKRTTMPKDYTLILGDSYADGWGDWVQSNDPGKNEPYATHDLLYQITDIDTVEGGFAGGSVLESLIRKPINRYRYLRKTLLYRVKDPKRVLFFFYEGNDLRDNLNRFTKDKLFEEPLDFKRVYDKTYFRWYLDTIVPKSDALYYDVKRFKWHYNLVSFHLARRMTERLFEKREKMTPLPIPLAKRGTNALMIKNEKIFVPRGDIISVPNLTENDMKLSLYMTGECLDTIHDFFPDAEFTIVYIPSPATSYEFISERLTVRRDNAPGIRVDKRSVVFERSDHMYQALETLAQEHSMGIIDSRRYFRDAAKTLGFLHGPRDWYHLNRQGYDVLAKAIVSEMDRVSSQRAVSLRNAGTAKHTPYATNAITDK